MATKKEKAKLALLAKIASDTKTTGYSTVKHAEHKESIEALVGEKKIFVGQNGIDANGNVALKAADEVLQNPPAPTPAPVEIPKPVITLVKVFMPPAPERVTRAKEEIYPFSTMELGTSFVIPTGPGMENPFKFLSAKVGAFMRKTSVDDPTGKTKLNRKKEPVPAKVPTKRFEVRDVKKGDKYPDGFEEPVTGARLYRVA